MCALSRSMRCTRAAVTVDAHPVPSRSVNSDAARISGKALKNWPWGSGEWGAPLAPYEPHGEWETRRHKPAELKQKMEEGLCSCLDRSPDGDCTSEVTKHARNACDETRGARARVDRARQIP